MIFENWKKWAGQIKQNIRALYFAARDPRVPLLAKLIIVLVVAYALSPIDLIPDFIPVIGYLDDLILLPVGIWLAIRLMPKSVWQECLQRAARPHPPLPRNYYAAMVIAVIWLVSIAGIVYWIWA